MYREFDEYVFNNFDINLIGINRKYYHSQRVSLISKTIAENLGCNLHDVKLATKIGLLHDVARFYEYDLFGEYNHKNNFDHGRYGVKLLKEDNFKKQFDIRPEDEDNLYSAIFYHNKLEIGKSYKNNMYCKIIRDADKLDIFYILSVDEDLKIKSNDVLIVSPKVQKSFNKEELTPAKSVKTKLDSIIYHLSYIFDLNYKYTYRYLKERNYVNKIYENIGKPEELKPYIDKLNEYIERRM